MNNCITELLQIKDKNIILDPTFKKEKIKGQTHFIFKGVYHINQQNANVVIVIK